MARNLSIGMTGPDVRDLQKKLNARSPTALARLNEDNIFGPKTQVRVKEFQRNSGLIADGIAGPKTMAALEAAGPSRPRKGCDCCSGDPSSNGRASQLADLFRSNRPVAAGSSFGFASNVAAPAGSGPIRMLTPAQQAVAAPVFGASLDFSTIFITDKSGIGGRPFTIAFPDSGQTVQIMNCGTFTPKDKTLIHELAHVWQSQHHSDKFRFMVNALDSQAEAAKTNLAEAVFDPLLALEDDFPLFFPFDAYAYHPSQSFTSMAAEQMASAIELREPGVLTHIQGIAMNAVDPACQTALSKVNFGDHRAAGVKG